MPGSPGHIVQRLAAGILWAMIERRRFTIKRYLRDPSPLQIHLLILVCHESRCDKKGGLNAAHECDPLIDKRRAGVQTSEESAA
jgi:hypothetical protein